MNQSIRYLMVAFLGWAALFGVVTRLGAAESAIVSAVVSANRANLRSSPSLQGDVVGSLTKGQSVAVLQQIPVHGPQPEDPPFWARVRLPSSVKVWVYAALVDAKSGAVTSRELKIRSGPGRNFPAVGELEEGDLVTPVRTVDGWMQIEPPAAAVAYLAGNVIQISDGPAVATPNAIRPSAASSPVSQPERAALDRPVVPGVAVPPRSVPLRSPLNPGLAPATPTPAPVTAPPAAAQPSPGIFQPRQPLPAPTVDVSAQVPAHVPSSPAPGLTIPEARVTSAVPAAPASVSTANETKAPVRISSSVRYRQPELIYDDTRPRRVFREGMVRYSMSPDAPSTFELVSFRRGEGLQDYLMVEDPKKSDLSKWQGKRVFVEGEEFRDRRWRTPVLKVISVRSAN